MRSAKVPKRVRPSAETRTTNGDNPDASAPESMFERNTGPFASNATTHTADLGTNRRTLESDTASLLPQADHADSQKRH
jgi:hypothetical protein